MGQLHLSGAETQPERISKIGDPPEKISSVIDREIFRSGPGRRVRKEDCSKGGRPPLDVARMFISCSHRNDSGRVRCSPLQKAVG